MDKHISEKDARQVIAIIDKILASNESIIEVCNRCRKLAEKFSSENKVESRTAQLIIMHYSNLCAAGGGMSATGGLIPGVGIVLSLLGAGALDAFFAMKFELEMNLALTHLAGFDIANPYERKLAFLMACSALEDAYASDKEPTMANVIDIAMGEYSTRELSKTLTKAFVRVLMMIAAKKWVKFFPIVGIGIEASVNKVLSTRLGRECWRAIKLRRGLNTDKKVDK